MQKDQTHPPSCKLMQLESADNISPALLLVGLSARIGNGRTNGHTVCGIARFSKRSIMAIVVFFVSAMSTDFVTHHLIGAGSRENTRHASCKPIVGAGRRVSIWRRWGSFGAVSRSRDYCAGDARVTCRNLNAGEPCLHGVVRSANRRGELYAEVPAESERR